MNLLLDTHGFLWSLFTPDKLSKAAVREIKSPNNDLAVSVVTFWEISLKYTIGKLELTGVKPEELPDFAGQMNLEILPLTADEASSFHKLPRLSHKDPFDRIIIWHSIFKFFTSFPRRRESSGFGKSLDSGSTLRYARNDEPFMYASPKNLNIEWQAIQRKMTLVSKDRDFNAYRKFGLRTFW